MFTAKLGFAQAGGGPSDSAGRSVQGGLTGQAVTCTAALAGGTAPYTYSYERLDVPATSALSLGQFATTAAPTFTPDGGGGCYRVRVTVTDHNGSVASDIRNFAVADANGVCLPSFRPDPTVDYTQDEYNFGGQLRGWSYLIEKTIEALENALGGASGRNVLEVTGAGIALTIATTKDTTIKASAFGANRTTKLPAAPAVGQICTFKAAKDGSLTTRTWTIDANGSTIDGASTATMGPGTNYGDGSALTAQYTGTSWSIMV